MDYNFYLDKPFLGLKFDDTPQNVKRLLGNPTKIVKEEYSKESGEFDETFYYDKDILRVVFSYYEGKYSGLSIYTKKMYLNKINLFNEDKVFTLKLISAYSKLDNTEYAKERVELETCISEEYEFKDLGLTLWFLDNNLDEVCIFKKYDFS